VLGKAGHAPRQVSSHKRCVSGENLPREGVVSRGDPEDAEGGSGRARSGNGGKWAKTETLGPRAPNRGRRSRLNEESRKGGRAERRRRRLCSAQRKISQKRAAVAVSSYPRVLQAMPVWEPPFKCRHRARASARREGAPAVDSLHEFPPILRVDSVSSVGRDGSSPCSPGRSRGRIPRPFRRGYRLRSDARRPPHPGWICRTCRSAASP